LAAINITAADLKTERNATAADLLAKGFTPADLFAAGYTLESLADAGVDASVLAALGDDGSSSGGAVAAVLALLVLVGVCGYVWHRRRTVQQQKDQANQVIAALGGDGMVEMMDNPLSTLRRKATNTPAANSTTVENKVAMLGRQRNVVINNAFSIPFDDAGDAANDDDAVVAAAAAAAGYVLVTTTDDDEPGAGTTIPDYDPAEVGVEGRQEEEREGEDAAQYYQNVDIMPWEGAVLEGPRDYENAPSTTMLAGNGRVVPAATSRTASTSSTATLRKTSMSSNTIERYENVPVLRKTVRRAGNTRPAKVVAMHTEDAAPSTVIPKKTSGGMEMVPPGTADEQPEGYEFVEVRKTRTHLPGCKCGGRACKLEPVWWCEVCGSVATAALTFAGAEACELNHRTLDASTMRQQPADGGMEMYAEAEDDEADVSGNGSGGGVGGGGSAGIEPRMYSQPNDAGQTYADGAEDDAPQMYSAPTDAGETYDGIEPVNEGARMYSQPTEGGQVYTSASDV
jgi:hypothetical protein